MKRIGVLGGMHGSIVGITYPYYEFASRYGDVVIINPLSDTIDENIDMLILTGGADLDPGSYGAKPHLRTNKPNPHREWFEKNVFPLYIKSDMPLFGICLGLQSINTYFGGTLDQHNSLYHPFSSKSRWDLVHELHFNTAAREDKRFNLSLQKGKIQTNSLHHQAIDKLGQGLVVHAVAKKDDRGVEIIAHKTKPIIGVQFHPEELSGDPILYIMDSYIRYLLNYRNG